MMRAMSYLDRINACRRPDLADYLPFTVEGRTVGYVKPAFARQLADHADTFTVTRGHVALAETLDGPKSRSEAVDGVLDRLREKGMVSAWRGEKYPVAESFTAPALFEMERAAVPLFGVIGYGVHLNGIVRDADGPSLWIGRRSLSKPTGPGLLDQMVAGGQPVGLSLMDNLIKECAEEADVPPDLAAASRPVGEVSYVTERPEGLRRDVLYVYDLELPGDFTPRNTDGEVEAFLRMPFREVAERVAETEDFKFNCALVVIDFLIRHGVIEPDHPDYPALVRGLRGLD